MLVALLLLVFAAPVWADELRPAVIEFTQRDAAQWSLEWRLPIAPSARGEAPVLAEPVIPDGCSMTATPVLRASPLALTGSARLTCEGALAGDAFGLTHLFGSSDAIARFAPINPPAQTFRLTASNPTAIIAAEPDIWQVARDYFIIGAEHILFGWDHLLFVIALVFLVRSGWAVVKAATAFTLAHSITLVATTLGYAGMPSRPVEALIALSIVFLAVEVIRALREPDYKSWTRRAPWLVAFGFGLLHGFGFAGALAEIGLPQGEIASALVAFNLGVEAGQLVVIAAVLGWLWLIRRSYPQSEKRWLTTPTYCIGIIGSFWFVERIVG